MLAENVEGIANATETVEMLNQAQENLQEVAKNPGIVGTWQMQRNSLPHSV